MHLLRKCPCPLWLFKPRPDAGSPLRLLAAIDPDRDTPGDDRLTRTILELGTSLRRREPGATLDILHCWHAPYENTLAHNVFVKAGAEEIRRYVQQIETAHRAAFDGALAPFDLTAAAITTRFEKADPTTFIPAFVERHRIDTLVMGTVARTGIAGLLIGNTAEAALTDVDCSVVAVKPAGFQTPVTPG